MKPYNIRSYTQIYLHDKNSRVKWWFYGLAALFILFLFLPWTQNIRARGSVTTLYQDQRPQQVNTLIGGRVMKWHIKEGDYVKAGDTLVQLAEVKVDYLDPNLLERTKEQLAGKQLSVTYYKNKVGATQQQIGAINAGLTYKLNQLQNKLRQLELKVQADSAEAVAAANDLAISTKQFGRQKLMYDSGLVSLTQLETRTQQYQNALAKKISADNKFANSKQELTITRIEMNAVEQENIEKVSKAQGDQFQSLTQIASGQADIAKLENQYASYNIRNGMYCILATQDGQVVKAQKAGIGEFVKEGDMIAEIVPDKIKYAVELYVQPLDLPLVANGQKVRFLFDGFPAIVFSGWPRASSGTFGGVITAIESNVSKNGKFRVLVQEDPADKPWPKELRMGTGAQGIALLKDVPVWYELWRNINGFPADYYQRKETTTNEKK
ncbi:MAG TPA: HlyD family efflux transporter periplasmic adaptor subunit [Ferruginibacter sp.]|jgi:multidrug efflux pump subunit AcrA (membrane-fusion protein)|nr:HlyD family efflux transporter periplasmic adaptor subunit [Ferruginibacter sp.]HMX79152.1 HlyD family efflux transporter periplasmic adaptor subunit [Ferruginibacter sp.]HNA16765.1 HlyD family efflux transporter periplasmic adaptor subunit [Ferruginibacter sp.]HNG62108.1 HlyD family efflux transporter periplasmic adaptor subunit [Ferruginibacter sp.]HNJ27448.1 HlyD family efflux transporter periplasmic adaptor subunit [Ferruginibacter sp.]